MKTIIFYLSVSILIALGSCSSSSDQGDYFERATPVLTQTVTAKTSTIVSFLARATWGSSCGSFSRSEVARTDSVYFIKVFGRQPKDAVCLTVVISFEAPITVNIPSPGTYSFKFWKSDSTSKDTTFTVQ